MYHRLIVTVQLTFNSHSEAGGASRLTIKRMHVLGPAVDLVSDCSGLSGCRLQAAGRQAETKKALQPQLPSSQTPSL